MRVLNSWLRQLKVQTTPRSASRLRRGMTAVAVLGLLGSLRPSFSRADESASPSTLPATVPSGMPSVIIHVADPGTTVEQPGQGKAGATDNQAPATSPSVPSLADATTNPAPSPEDQKSPRIHTVPFAGGGSVPVAARGPVPAQIKITPEAKAVLDGVRNSYRSLTSLRLAGTYSADFEVGDQSIKESAPFTASFQAPDKFRHEMKDDVLAGCTGAKAYVFKPAESLYFMQALEPLGSKSAGGDPGKDLMKDASADAPKKDDNGAASPAATQPARLTLADLPLPVRQVVETQNLSLSMALSPDPVQTLIGAAKEISRGPDAVVDGRSCPVLMMTNADGDYHILVDPDTHLLRRVELNAKSTLEKRGAQDVRSAMLVVDYTAAKPNEPAAAGEESFDWSPPSGAHESRAVADAGGADEGAEAKALEGKPAPDFELMGLDGKTFHLKDHKGSVLILDFWATWCGPCVGSLPTLDRLYRDKKADGLEIYLVNLHEDADTVRKFIEQKQLSPPVLLDTEQTNVAGKFAVQAIPETIVIGKDGVIRKVFVGAGPEEERQLREAVETAMKSDP